MQDTTEKKVFDYMKLHNMLMPGDAVVAGISGGADSVCLLLMLVEWSRKTPLKLQVVHINHGIRKEAGRDAEYVKELCRRYEIPFTLVEADVHSLARENRCSEEEMGRRVRYDAFAQAAGETSAKIAVAHNCNDQAETMLFHLFRGSGLSGLCGMRPVRDRIIRPLLCLERTEIEAYLVRRGLEWRTDVTNEEDDYIRNRIRHHILPYAEEEIVQGSTAHMAQTAVMLQETEDFLQRMTREAYEKLVRRRPAVEAEVENHGRTGRHREEDGGQREKPHGYPGVSPECFHISCQEFNGLDKVIGKRLIHRLLCDLSPGGKDIAYVHVKDVMELFTREGNRYICLPYGIRARRQYGEVVLECEPGGDTGRPKPESGSDICRKQLEPDTDTGQYSLNLQELLQKNAVIPLNSFESLHFQVVFEEKCKDILQNEYTKWFDYDKIRERLTVRTRKTGDFLSIRGIGEDNLRHKSVKDFMVDQKIPRNERDQIPMIAEGSHVLWLVGYRISEYYKVSKNTKRILQVQLIRGCDSGEMEENNG